MQPIPGTNGGSYQAPALERFGSFRELTRAGLHQSAGDGYWVCGPCSDEQPQGGINGRS